MGVAPKCMQMRVSMQGAEFKRTDVVKKEICIQNCSQ